MVREQADVRLNLAKLPGGLTQKPREDCRTRIFLLSPASLSGVRGRLVLNPSAGFDLASRFHREGVSVGELFTFISGLYFRGKLAYAQAFARAPDRVAGIYVITTCLGLVSPGQIIGLAEQQAMMKVPVDPLDDRYRAPLDRDARMIGELAPAGCEIVLLGSIATPKYVDPLVAIFGQRLLCPAEFVGLGDMSRGGLMLRCVREGNQLGYVPVATAVPRVLPASTAKSRSMSCRITFEAPL